MVIVVSTEIGELNLNLKAIWIRANALFKSFNPPTIK